MRDPDILGRLRTYGSDLSRWPDSRSKAQAALLADREFRGAFEDERGLDRKLAEHRDALDLEISRSGALGRVRKSALARSSANALSDMPWRRIAAAVVVACVLGGAFDLMLPQQLDEPVEVALGDPLFDLSSAEPQ